MRNYEARSQRREELLDLAMDVIRSKGPHASMEEIAAGCGVTKPILYRHFGDRDGLVKAMAVRFATDLVLDLTSWIHSTESLDRRIRGAVETFVSHIERDPELYCFLTAEAPRGAEQFVAGLVAEEVVRVLRETLEAEGLDPSGAEAWGVGLVGMVHFAGAWWVQRRSMPKGELVAHLERLIWGGLGGLGLDRSAAGRPAFEESLAKHGSKEIATPHGGESK